MYNPASYKTFKLDGTEGVALEYCPYAGMEDVLAVGCLDGSVVVLKGDLESGLKLENRFVPCYSKSNETPAVRTITWLTHSKKKQYHRLAISDSLGKVYVMDTRNGKVLWKVITADESNGCGVSGLAAIGENHLATGDDMGVLNIWNLRKQYPESDPDSEWMNLEFFEDDNPIQQLAYSPEPPMEVRYESKLFTGESLLVTGGNYMAQFHIEINKIIGLPDNEPDFGMSDPMDGDVGRFSIAPSQSLVLTGNEEGMVSLWKWAQWGEPISRLELAEPQVSEEGMVVNDVFTYDDFIGLAACSDGSVRILTLYPLADAGVIGEHYDGGAAVGSDEHTSVEYMALNHAYDTIATLGLNGIVQIMALKPEVIEAAAGDRRNEFGCAVKGKKKLTEDEKELASEARGAKSGFFGDL